MNHSDGNAAPDILPAARLWANALESVIESMVSTRPRVDMQPGQGAIFDSLFWWKQSFNISTAGHLWMGAPEHTWDDLGRYILAKIGVDAPALDDVRSTCADVVAQVGSAFATGLSGMLSKEITCASLATVPFKSDKGVAFTFTIDAGVIRTVGTLVFDSLLPELVASTVQRPRALPDSVLRTSLPARVVLGRAKIPIKDVWNLTVGSVIKLDRSVDDPADVLIHGQLIARGQVVSVNGNYGVKILMISSDKCGGTLF